MKIFLKLAVFVLALILIQPKIFAKALEETREYFPPVLMFHDIREKPLNYMDVQFEDLKKILDWLQKDGWKTLSMDEFVSCVEQGKPFPKKSVLITFDDGYTGIWNYAAPELEKRNMKATFFIVPKTVDVAKGNYPHITTEQLKSLANNPLFSIGCHTMSHSALKSLTEDQLTEEIVNSKKVLEEMTGTKIKAFSYPEGGYNKSIIKKVIDAGYSVAFAVQDRGLFHESPRWSIPRIFVGYELGNKDFELFKWYVRNYKKMPAGAFAERWEPLN